MSLRKISEEMDSVLFSIIIPVYNVEEYLAECLDSVINQTYRHLEIIVVNDGSTDSSMDIIEQYSVFDKRIRVISQTNQGLSAARNAGIRCACGDYLLFVDSDDYISLDSCEVLSAKLKAMGDVDVVTFGLNRLVGGKCTVENVCKERVFDDWREYYESAVQAKYFNAFSCTKAYSRKHIIDNSLEFAVGLLYEDLYFVARTLVLANRIVVLDLPLYYYRIRNNSISSTIVKEKDTDVLTTVKMLEAFFTNERKGEFLKSDTYLRLIYSWVSHSIVYKYVMRAPFSMKGTQIVKSILNDAVYEQYVKRMYARSGMPVAWRVAAWLSRHCYPLFVLMIYIRGRISR